MKPNLNKLKRIFFAPFVWLAASIFLIEELIWDATAALMAKLGAARIIHAIESHIAKLPPRWAFFIFILPSAILIPAKLFGLHAIATGHWLLGGCIFIIAKILGLALFARIFNLTRPVLMQLAWFARLYHRVMGYRNRIHLYLQHWQAYQNLKRRLVNTVQAIKLTLKN